MQLAPTPRQAATSLTAVQYGPSPAPRGSGLRECGVAAIWAVLTAAVIAAPGAISIITDLRNKERARLAAIEAAQAYERIVAAPAAASLPIEQAAHGRDLFATTCVACHGPTGTGVDGLGKNLCESDFVAAASDADLVQFIIAGRPTANPPMPPRAGRPDLTETDIADLVVYLRGLQDARRLPELPAMVAAKVEVTAEETADALKAAGGDAELAGWIASGKKIYATTCIACHGPDGAGVKGNGKPLATSEFVASLNDDDLLAFILKGRDPSDPKNTTGVGMPPKGGNPVLSEDDLLDVISYLRSLQPATQNNHNSASAN